MHTYIISAAVGENRPIQKGSRTMKKFVSLLIVLALALSVCSVSLADESVAALVTLIGAFTGASSANAA